MTVADSLRENEAKQDEERRKVSERRVAAMAESRIRHSQLSFARDFACQQNSVSQALRNHDRAEAKKEKQTKMAEAVRVERERNVEKQALVRKYMEHRRLMNQAEVCWDCGKAELIKLQLNQILKTSSLPEPLKSPA